MNQSLTDNWNSVVTPQDTVYILGDFAYKMQKRLSEYVEPLNGTKHLILGNHDRLPMVEYERNFATVQPYLELELRPRTTIVLFHYPILSWNKKAHGSWHIYGHVHTAGQLPSIAHLRTWNASVEVNNYKPVSIDDLAKTMKTKSVDKKEP